MSDPTELMDEWEKRRAQDLKDALTMRALLLAKLRELGITGVVADYDGSGDSGQVEGIAFFKGAFNPEADTMGLMGEAITDAETAEVKIRVPSSDQHWDKESRQWVKTRGETDTAIATVMERICYMVLSSKHGGWENNEGAFGQFVWDVGTDALNLTHNTRFEGYETENETL